MWCPGKPGWLGKGRMRTSPNSILSRSKEEERIRVRTARGKEAERVLDKGNHQEELIINQHTRAHERQALRHEKLFTKTCK